MPRWDICDRTERERHTWVASFSTNSVNTRVSSVSCTNLKSTVVKIELLDVDLPLIDSVCGGPRVNPAVVPLIENKCILHYYIRPNQNSSEMIALWMYFHKCKINYLCLDVVLNIFLLLMENKL